MVSCIPLPLLTDIGMSRQDPVPSKAVLKNVSGQRLKNHGTVEIEVSCNSNQRKTKFYVTSPGKELLLGLNSCISFELVQIAETCIQRNISASLDKNMHAPGPSDMSTPETVEAVHIMQKSEADYTILRKKWKEDRRSPGRSQGNLFGYI